MSLISYQSLLKVVGGKEAVPYEFPYQVLLEIDHGTRRFKCGGVILSTIFILTAAHCVEFISERKPFLTITAGEHDRDEDEKNLQRRFVSRYEMHANFSHIPTVKHDIAVLVLSEPLVFNEFVNSIRYPMTKTEFNGTAVAIGWGRSHNLTSSFGPSALHKVILPIVPKQKCKEIWKQLGVRPISNQMICVGGALGKDICLGDSGGALICTDKSTNDSSVLCGVASVTHDCGKTGIPSRYTEVSSYSDWIQKTIQKLGHCSSNEFQCLSKCIPKSRKCNGKLDCEHGEDEVDCGDLKSPSTTKPILCQSGEFNCYLNNSPMCITSKWKCDGEKDCYNGEDEFDCPGPLPSTSTTTKPVTKFPIFKGMKNALKVAKI